MSDTVLLLGPVVFQEFEIPPCINFGGRQRLAMHRMPDGARIVDALGRDDAQIAPRCAPASSMNCEPAD